ncbi:MAG: iron ABC transporter permease [Candidatus Omnitrophica bacterium]|nr:iron ABC transporter permease [Candidatus Omnitrophota bacterium]
MSKRVVLIVLFIALVLSVVFSLFSGPAKVNLPDLFRADSQAGTILYKIRLPRVMLALMVGASLAVSGCVFQAVLSNPLADPYTLGISGGAAFGASLCIILGLGAFWLPVSAFSGAILCIALVYMVAGNKRFSNTGMILGGVMLNFVFSSLVMFLFAVAKSENVHQAILWLMGDISLADMRTLKLMLPFFVFGWLAIFYLSPDIDILTLGEEKATHLGLAVARIKAIIFIAASLITAVGVAACGIIGFVGLVIPHFTRKLVGPGHRFLIPASVLAGATFLVLADTLARTVVKPLELPVGVITGLFGGVFFLILLIRAKDWRMF